MTAERTYNYIYNSLVNDENDIVGIISYSVYKRHKIEFINNFQKEHGRPPSDDDLKAFTDISTSLSTCILSKRSSSSGRGIFE